jgi:hypothetical protein
LVTDIMNKFIAPILAAGVLALAGCTQGGMGWEYQTISGPNDRVLGGPVAQGWEPVGISVARDGTKWFLLKRQKAATHPIDYQYKTVASTNGQEILDAPANQGWDVVGVATGADGSQWFLLKKVQTQVKVSLAN